MELLRKLVKFKPPQKDMKQVYIAYVRSLLEQSCTVWHSSLTLQNSNDLERVQKVALRLILNEQFKNYEQALIDLDLETLALRREKLSLIFAQKCLKNPKIKHLFPPNKNKHAMETRDFEHFQVLHANTERLKKSPIVYMQNQLNSEIKRKKQEEIYWTSS